MTPYRSALEAALEAMRKASTWIYYRRLAGGDPISEEEELLHRAVTSAEEALRRPARRLTEDEIDGLRPPSHHELPSIVTKHMRNRDIRTARALESALATIWGVKLP